MSSEQGVDAAVRRRAGSPLAGHPRAHKSECEFHVKQTRRMGRNVMGESLEWRSPVQ